MDPENPKNFNLFGKTPTQWIHEIIYKKKAQLRTEIENMQVSQHNPTEFECRLTVLQEDCKDIKISIRGRNKQEAKQKAAISLLNTLNIGEEQLKALLLIPNAKGEVCSLAKMVLEPPEEDVVPNVAELVDLSKMYKQGLESLCSDIGLDRPKFEVLNISGPPHNPQTMVEGRVFKRGPDMEEDFVFQADLCGKVQSIKHYVSSKLMELIDENRDVIFRSVCNWALESEENRDSLLNSNCKFFTVENQQYLKLNEIVELPPYFRNPEAEREVDEARAAFAALGLYAEDKEEVKK